jgi:hypothetical protein
MGKIIQLLRSKRAEVGLIRELKGEVVRVFCACACQQALDEADRRHEGCEDGGAEERAASAADRVGRLDIGGVQGVSSQELRDLAVAGEGGCAVLSLPIFDLNPQTNGVKKILTEFCISRFDELPPAPAPLQLAKDPRPPTRAPTP